MRATIPKLGSVRRITSPEGTEIARFTYDAWGRPEKTVAEGYEASALGVANYTGHLYDEALELYYAKARMYSPEMKKFTAVDPVKSGMNWTGYCLDNPLKFIDPDGEAAQEASRWQKVKKRVRDAIDTTASGVWGGIAGIIGGTATGISYAGETTIGRVFPSTQQYFNGFNCDIAQFETGARSFAINKGAYDLTSGLGTYLAPGGTIIKAWNITVQANDRVEEARKNSGGDIEAFKKALKEGSSDSKEEEKPKSKEAPKNNKEADEAAKDLGSKNTRTGTYDGNLKWIGE